MKIKKKNKPIIYGVIGGIIGLFLVLFGYFPAWYSIPHGVSGHYNASLILSPIIFAVIGYIIAKYK